MKRALVSCAALAILGAAACSKSNPTLPPGVVPLDSGASERGPVLPPDTRPPASEAGGGVDFGGINHSTDVPLGSDGATKGIDAGSPSLLTVTILGPVADGGGAGPLAVATSDRLAPSVRVDVQAQGGDPTADVVTLVKAVLMPENSSTVAVGTALNQTQYEVIPESNGKSYFFGDTPLDLGNVPSGTYTLVVTATTAGGSSASASLILYLDGGPVISFLQPAEGAFVRGSVLVTAIVVDSRWNVSSVEFSVGQTPIAASAVTNYLSQYTATLDFGSFNPPLDGPQVVTLTATNGNGVVSLASRKFTVDNEGPTISATKPAPGELIGRLITVSAQVVDPAGVMESSVIAVVAHGDVHFEVNLEKDTDGTYRHTFDTTIFPSISFRAQDVLGNQSSVGYLVSLDNTPPVMDIDPPANVRLLRQDGTCSWPFDPVGPDAIDDGSVVTQLFDIRARVEDLGNTPLTGTADFVPISTVDPASVKVLILDDTSLPLVVDTSDPPDGICDDINPDLVPSVAPQSSRDAQLLNMVSLPPNSGAGDFTFEPGSVCSGSDSNPPKPFCDTTYSLLKHQVMTYVMGYATNLPSIWTVGPVVGDGLQCAGRQFDASNNLHDGLACVAVVASDKLGNKQVSRPVRICVAAGQLGSAACTAAAMGGSDITTVSFPSAPSGGIVVGTQSPVLGRAGAAIVAGDTVLFNKVAPAVIGFVNGGHAVTPLDPAGTQFALTGMLIQPASLYLDNLDGTDPVYKGHVGIIIQNGVEVQVVTDTASTVVDPAFAGRVVLTSPGSWLGGIDGSWTAAGITSTGFRLSGLKVSVSGTAVAPSALPDCTGTVVKRTAGLPATVDGTKPCKPWMSYPKYEYLQL